MGLLGMDVYQDKLTDWLFGDLVLKGQLVKIADNIHYGSNSVDKFSMIFTKFMDQCQIMDLRLKPSALQLNVCSADILGLHWNSGTLTPSKHKLDPLAHYNTPRTVKGLRGFLGVRWHEICLEGPKLAKYTKALDKDIATDRPRKEEIVWTPVLMTAFQKIQEILKKPLVVSVPRVGDTPYIITEMCTTLPAGGTIFFKMTKSGGVSTKF